MLSKNSQAPYQNFTYLNKFIQLIDRWKQFMNYFIHKYLNKFIEIFYSFKVIFSFSLEIYKYDLYSDKLLRHQNDWFHVFQNIYFLLITKSILLSFLRSFQTYIYLWSIPTHSHHLIIQISYILFYSLLFFRFQYFKHPIQNYINFSLLLYIIFLI